MTQPSGWKQSWARLAYTLSVPLAKALTMLAIVFTLIMIGLVAIWAWPLLIVGQFLYLPAMFGGALSIYRLRLHRRYGT